MTEITGEWQSSAPPDECHTTPRAVALSFAAMNERIEVELEQLKKTALERIAAQTAEALRLVERQASGSWTTAETHRREERSERCA
ncbi:MAG: hypothetical protein WA208_16760 [Thermoanaerobaculia bacterium]